MFFLTVLSPGKCTPVHVPYTEQTHACEKPNTAQQSFILAHMTTEPLPLVVDLQDTVYEETYNEECCPSPKSDTLPSESHSVHQRATE